MRKALSIIVAAALTGCATAAPPSPPGAGQAYRAHGTEPFWGVTIAGGRIVYEAPDQPSIAVPMPRRSAIANGYRYTTAQMRIDVTRERCNDGMSDLYYPDRFQIYFPLADRPLDGCGGAVLPPDTLADTGWGIAQIDGETIAPAEDYALQFADGRLFGQAGCNRFSGPYAQARSTLRPGAVAATRMACPPPRMAHEARMLRLLGGTVRIRYPDGASMVLSGSGVSVRLKRL